MSEKIRTVFGIVGYTVFIFVIVGGFELSDKVPDEVSEICGWAIMALMYIGAIACLSVFVYWFFYPNIGYRFFKTQNSLWSGIYFGVFLSCSAVVYCGIYSCLIFLPDHARSGAALMLMFALTFFLVYVFYKYEHIRQEHSWLKFDFELQKEKKQFRYLTESQIREKMADFQQRREKLPNHLTIDELFLKPLEFHLKPNKKYLIEIEGGNEIPFVTVRTFGKLVSRINYFTTKDEP
jgi:hypothetical protein